MRQFLRILLICSAAIGLSACYHPDILQGNDLTQAQIHQLHLGMSKADVEKTLSGKPVLTNAFSEDQLTYVYTDLPNHGDFVEKKLILLFKDDKLVKIENQYH